MNIGHVGNSTYQLLKGGALQKTAVQPSLAPKPAAPTKPSGHPTVDIGSKNYAVDKKTLNVNTADLNKEAERKKIEYMNAQATGNKAAMAKAEKEANELYKAGATLQSGQATATTKAYNNYLQSDNIKQALTTKNVNDLNAVIVKAKNDYAYAQKTNDTAGMAAAAELSNLARANGGTISASASLEEAKKQQAANLKPAPAPAPQKSTMDVVIDSAKNFGVGVKTGVTNGVKDTVDAVVHFDDTLKGIKNAVVHPIQTGKAIAAYTEQKYTQFTEAPVEQKANLAGQFVGGAVVAVVGTKGANAAASGAKGVAAVGKEIVQGGVQGMKDAVSPKVVTTTGITVNLPSNSQTMVLAKGNSGSSTASATDKAKILENNKEKGAKFETQAMNVIKEESSVVVTQVTAITKSGVKTRFDFLGLNKQNGKVEITEAKSSETAPLTKNQKAAYPEIAQSGATIVGKGKPPFNGGTELPPTEVKVVRPSDINNKGGKK